MSVMYGFYPILEALAKQSDTRIDLITSKEVKEFQKTFLDILSSKEANLFDDEHEFLTNVGVDSFLCGFCYHLAVKLKAVFNYNIEAIFDNGECIHMYCTYKSSNGKKYYIDSRGITDNWKIFIGIFGFDESMVDEDIPLEQEEIAEIFIQEECEVDEISDAMCEWYISNFKKYVDISQIIQEAA